jgi:hypothetical protein
MRALIIIALLISSIAIARADSSTGCGLGSMIWKQNSIVSALFRGTTNHSFSSQLFGITTGTSGCSQHSIVKRDMYPVYYAEANLPELRIEMAQGQGEYLTTFAQVLGCTPEAQVQFMKWAQGSYSSMFSSSKTTPAQMLKGLGQEFKATAIAASCDNLAMI